MVKKLGLLSLLVLSLAQTAPAAPWWVSAPNGSIADLLSTDVFPVSRGGGGYTVPFSVFQSEFAASNHNHSGTYAAASHDNAAHTATYITGNQTITLSGVVTGSGTTSITTSMAADAVALGSGTTGTYVGGVTTGGGLTKTGNEAALLGITVCSSGETQVYNGTAYACTAVSAASHTHSGVYEPAGITESDISDLGAYLENIAEDPTPQLGGVLDLNGKGIMSLFTCGDTIVTGDLVYMDTTSDRMEFADADSEVASSGLLAIALESCSDGDTGKKFLLYGVATVTTEVSGPGTIQYISTTAGDCTETRPSATGDFIRVVGYGLDDDPDQIMFMPSGVWVEL